MSKKQPWDDSTFLEGESEEMSLATMPRVGLAIEVTIDKA